MNDECSFFYCSEQATRRHMSKSESLLVSLLKQEAITDKKQDTQANNISSSIKMTEPFGSIQKVRTINNTIAIDSNNIEVKLEKNDVDFILNDTQIPKKTSTKSQVTIYGKNIHLILLVLCLI